MKTCKKCHRELAESEFSNRKGNKDGLHIYCKECVHKQHEKYDTNHKNERKISKQLYYQSNREKILNQIKESRPLGSRNEYLKQYYIKNKLKMDHHSHEYCKTHRKQINKWCREYYKDPSKRIARNMYNRVRIAIFTQLALKSQKTTNLCGCTWEELVAHIEKQFKPGMSWENYGRYENKWSIDHIIPCDKFDLTKSEEQAKCFHYTNLQPLWANENSSKRNT